MLQKHKILHYIFCHFERKYDKVRGFNQVHTVQGFSDEVKNRPNYKPQNSLNNLLSETNTISADDKFEHNQNQQREEFKFNQVFF